MYANVYQPEPKTVDIQNFAFVPETIVVQTGTTVRWTNQDAAPHTVTSNTGLFDSGTLQNGETFEFTFDQPGRYAYFCAIHPFMTGRVIVVDQGLDIFLPVILR
jgi:plastocyanin